VKFAFTPPWDQPCWLILNVDAFLGNLDNMQPRDAFLDLRSNLLERIASHLLPDLKRYGLKGFLTNKLSRKIDREFREGWWGILVPPFSSGEMIEAIRCGFTPVLGHVSEAIQLSNTAQSLGKPQPMLIRVRDPDLMADQGQTSVLAILEIVSTLPMVEMKGFFLEGDYSAKHKFDSFLKAIVRHFPDISGLVFLGSEGKSLPRKVNFFRVIGTNPVGFQPTGNISATLTFQGWGIPISARNDSIRVSIDIGKKGGTFFSHRPKVLVENLVGTVLDLEDHRIIVEIQQRPVLPSPWIVTFMGLYQGMNLSSLDWQADEIEITLEAVGRKFPIFLQERDNFTRIPL